MLANYRLIVSDHRKNPGTNCVTLAFPKGLNTIGQTIAYYPSPAEEPTMAKTKVNKSKIVREILAATPEMKAKEVVAAMAAKGHKITDALVYTIKGSMTEKKKRKKRVVKAAKAAVPSSNGQVSKGDAITMIREVKALAEKAGGYEKLKELVDALAE
jgi:hypothetical protein